MTEERKKSRLAAIFYADMVGYSRLANEDEEVTHKSLRNDLDQFSAETELLIGSTFSRFRKLVDLRPSNNLADQES